MGKISTRQGRVKRPLLVCLFVCLFVFPNLRQRKPLRKYKNQPSDHVGRGSFGWSARVPKNRIIKEVYKGMIVYRTLSLFTSPVMCEMHLPRVNTA